jgi:putative transposase, yhgA-like
MPFGRKIQQNRRPARSGMINDMTCILQISVLHQNFHAASNVQKNKKEKLMGEKDITEKILEDHNDVFADIINGLVFAGEQKILAESLENTAVHSQYKADDEKVHELERDIAKY